MTLTMRLILGTALLVVCALVHIALVALSIPVFGRITKLVEEARAPLKNAVILCFGVIAIVAAHTVQIWSWAVAFYLVQAFDRFETSFYFATVTYTTLGYGDLILGEGLRIFGTFASIAGLLTFGISTAFLIGIIVRLIPVIPPKNE